MTEVRPPPTDAEASAAPEASGASGAEGAQGGGASDDASTGLHTGRRREIHEANNRLAAVVMNVAFARATLDGSNPDAPLSRLDRADLATALEHAESAANQLAAVLRRMATGA